MNDETMGEIAHRKFKQQESSYALQNPDYVEHAFIYERKFVEGFLEGFEECYLQLTGKSLRAELMQKAKNV